MMRIFTLSLTSFCLILLLLTGAYIGFQNKLDIKNKPDQNVFHSAAMKSLSMTNNEKEAYFLKWAAQTKTQCSSIENARKIVPYPIKFPDLKLTGQIEGIYVNKSDNPQEKDVVVRFEGGYDNVELDVCYRPDKPNLEAHVKQMIEEKEKGYSHGDKVPKIIEVSGFPAWTIEPGYNVIDTQKFPRPGIVQWWDNGVFYTLIGTGGDNGTSLNELIDIASTIIKDSSCKPEGCQIISEFGN